MSGVPSFFNCLLAVYLLSGVPSFFTGAVTFVSFFTTVASVFSFLATGFAAGASFVFAITAFCYSTLVAGAGFVNLFNVYVLAFALSSFLAGVCAIADPAIPNSTNAAKINFFIVLNFYFYRKC